MSQTTATRTETKGDDSEFIQSLAKGLAVIEAFNENSPAMTLSEVARKTNLTPGSARRVLRTLQQLGYATVEGNRFRLMPRVLQLGFAYLSSLPFARLAQPRLTELTEEVNGSCSVSVLDGIEVVYVARATAKGLGRDYMSVGTRYPAHATSAGKVMLAALSDAEVRARYRNRRIEAPTPNSIDTLDRLLAELAQVRENGYWAINDQETLMGHRSIAVPLRSKENIQAALGVGCNVGEVSCGTLRDDYLPKLLDAASAIERLMFIHEQATDSKLYSGG
jgi:IclR family transcriptional regulator, pca regulon regulatory protein